MICEKCAAAIRKFDNNKIPDHFICNHTKTEDRKDFESSEMGQTEMANQEKKLTNKSSL
jgi:hypothetical protein